MLRSVPVKLRALKMKQTESSILILDFISVLQVKMKSYTLTKKERGNVWTWLKYTKVVHPRFLHVTLLSSHRGKKDRFVKKPKNILHHYLFSQPSIHPWEWSSWVEKEILSMWKKTMISYKQFFQRFILCKSIQLPLYYQNYTYFFALLWTRMWVPPRLLISLSLSLR